ncbi:hypothetical protein Tco_0432657 [Tanacetum coccineum]
MLLAYYGRITPFWSGSFRIVMVPSPAEGMGQNGLAKAEGTSVSSMVFSRGISCFDVQIRRRFSTNSAGGRHILL